MARKLPAKDVVVLLPGILDSVLQQDGHDVWALSKGAILRGLLSLGGSIRDLRLERDDPEARDLGDGVRATRLMPDVHLLPGFWKIDGYSKIKSVLHQRFDFEEGVNWFDFPYDWRRDNRAAAHRLAESSEVWLDAWRERTGDPDAKLVLVAHSMGGLVARYFLEVLEGWKNTRALLTFGTPYRGSVNALDYAANGFRKGFGPLGLDLTDLLRSLTSVYQLMPTYPCVDEGTGPLREIVDVAALPAGIDVARARAGAEFHGEIDDAVTRNGGYGRYDIHPMVGIFQPTRQSARVRDGELETLETYDGDDQGGDGTVPRVSATPLELSGDPRECYATQAHASLQNVDALLVQLMGILTRTSLFAYRASPFDGFRLEADDVVETGEPVRVRAVSGGPVVRVVATAEDVDTGARHAAVAELDGDGQATVDLGPLPAGVYRLTLADADASGISPVTDLVTVLDAGG